MWTLLRPRARSAEHSPEANEKIHFALLGVRRLLRHPVWREADPRQGPGLGVLLIPGFGVGDRSLTFTHKWLAARGYVPAGSRIGLNVGCTDDLVGRLEQRLVEHTEVTGGRVVLLGQSRGGWLARLVAVRRPDLVRGVVMMSSPVLDPLGARPDVVRHARFLARLTALGVPGLLSEDCSDGVVPWQLCLDPCAECVEVDSSHVGMGLEPAFYEAVSPRLAEWAATR